MTYEFWNLEPLNCKNIYYLLGERPEIIVNTLSVITLAVLISE